MELINNEIVNSEFAEYHFYTNQNVLEDKDYQPKKTFTIDKSPFRRHIKRRRIQRLNHLKNQ